MRLFIAFDLAIKVVDKLALLQEDLQRPIVATGATPRWTDAGNIRLTLKYMGELEESMVARAAQAAREVARRHPIFDIEAVGVGCHPDPSTPRILFVGTAEGAPLAQALQQDLESTLETLGIPGDDRLYYPRVTLGRVQTRRGKADLSSVLAPYESTPFGATQVKDMALFDSRLTHRGAATRVIERFPLTG